MLAKDGTVCCFLGGGRVDREVELMIESVAGARALATSYSGLKAAKSLAVFFRLFEEPAAALDLVRFGGIVWVEFESGIWKSRSRQDCVGKVEIYLNSLVTPVPAPAFQQGCYLLVILDECCDSYTQYSYWHSTQINITL